MNRSGRLLLTLLLAVLSGLIVGFVEAQRAAQAGHASHVVHVATHVTLLVAGALAPWLLFELIPGLRRAGPALAVAGSVAASVFLIYFLRRHVSEGLVDQGLGAPAHRTLAGRAGLRGLAAAAVGLVLVGALWGLFVRVVRWPWVPPTLIALVLVAGGVTGFQAINPCRVTLAADEGRGDLPYNVLWITIDTLRRDRLTQYGHDRPTSVALDRFGMTRFERCSATSNWTKAATASMLTGLYPAVHTAQEPDSLLPPEAVTVTERAAAAGMVTGFYTGNLNASGVFELDRGAGHGIRDPRVPPNPWLGTALGNALSAHTRLIEARDLNQYVQAFLDRAMERRFFLYVHYNDPHDPYRPPRDILEQFDPGYSGRVVEKPRARFKVTERELQHMLARYDGEIVSVFRGAAALIERLEQAGLLDRTLVILSVDHGEEFQDHGGWTHARTAYEEIVHVPLFVRPPGGGPATVDAEVNQVDLAPTVLDYLGLAPTMPMDGISLRPALEEGDPGDPQRPVLVEGHDRDVWSFRQGPWKVIESGREVVTHQLFRIDEDPGEQHDLSEDPEHAARLAALLAEGRRRLALLRDRAFPDHSMVLDPDLEEELRALGYVR